MTAKPRAPKPEIVVESRRVADLLLDPSNARKHSARNLDAIRASLRRHGQRKPLVIDPHGVVVAGNGTLTVMGEEGWEWCSVTVYDGTPEQARAYGLEDNRTAELASWDLDVLPGVLDTLPEDVRLDVGWSADELAKIMDEAAGDPHDSGVEDTYQGKYQVVVDCRDEADQEQLYETLTGEGRTCRTLTL